MRVEISSSTKARCASKSDAQGLVRRLPATAVRRQSGAFEAVQFTRGALVLHLKKVLRWESADPSNAFTSENQALTMTRISER